MSDYLRKQEETGEHIWLRYATQFTAAGRSHTIEMSVPLPVGASDETREQLLREAEKGLSHLISHVETRIPQILQHAQAHSQVRSTPASPAPASKAPLSRPASKPASVPAPPTANQSLPASSQVREQKKEAARGEEHSEIAARSNGISMPSLPGGGNGNLSRPEFIQAVKGLGLNIRQAMDRLKVKSLEGVNLREALDRLQYQLTQETGEAPDVELKTPAPQPPMTNSSAHRAVPSKQASPDSANEEDPFENLPVPVFDEEIEPEEEEDFAEPLDDFSPSLTPSSRSRARAIVDRLREARGTTTVNPGRLQVLHNVIGDQISEEQLLMITHRLWGVSILKRLKVDQVEVLIYWAKEDDFVNEAEAVLALLEEEG
jgi:hypothetical protein